MPIPIIPPIVEPAVPETTFDQWFFPNFAATNLNDAVNAKLTFDQAPQNSETGEFLWSGRVTTSGNFWDIVQNVPGAAQVMQDVLNILPAIKDYLDSKNA
jgi:hypothetical protein